MNKFTFFASTYRFIAGRAEERHDVYLEWGGGFGQGAIRAPRHDQGRCAGIGAGVEHRTQVRGRCVVGCAGLTQVFFVLSLAGPNQQGVWLKF